MKNNETRYIACSHCSKAKARCDRKVPCTRCISKQLVCQPRSARRATQPAAEFQIRQLRPLNVSRGEEQQTATEAKQNQAGADGTVVAETNMEPDSPAALLHLQPASVSYANAEETAYLSTEWLQQITPESSLHVPLAMVLDQNETDQSSPDLDRISELISYSASDALGEPYLEPATLNHTPRKSPGREGRATGGDNSPIVRLCPGQPRHWGEDWSSHMRVSLQRFEQTLNSREPWITSGTDASASSIATITDTTRDSLLVVTQLLLLQARDIHSRDHGRGFSSVNLTVVTLPPAKVLDDLLRSYVPCFEQYFGLSSSELQDPNTIMTEFPHAVKAAGILLLLMIGIGAAATPAPKLHVFATGLAQTCRTALSDMMEGDVASTRPDILSHCALLLLYLGMWSGERWLMRASCISGF
ncbi:transcriptional regulator family: Fungal Specific TF [Paecilomyces variotii]|nr:transcriptional regulator family: Fungal Specific TF [Paecilomyces variotii]